MEESTCVICGCTDYRACPGGCSWALKFNHGDAGVCSNCVEPFMALQAKALPETRKLFPVVLYLGSRKEANALITEVTQANPNLTCRRLKS